MQFSRQPQFHETETLAHFFDETSRDHETRIFHIIPSVFQCTGNIAVHLKTKVVFMTCLDKKMITFSTFRINMSSITFNYLRNISTYFNLFPCANCHFVMNANVADVTLYMDS